MTNIWVTSDHHFRHARVIGYNHREFANIREHDEALIDAWNSVVRKGDLVYYLGDFTLRGVKDAAEIFSRLNGKVAVLENRWHHDRQWINHFAILETKTSFVYTVVPIVVLDDTKKYSTPIVLCHYPFEVWDRKHYESIHLHGHSHGNLRRMHNRLDVGIDVAKDLLGEYRPFSLHEAISLANSYYEPVVEV